MTRRVLAALPLALAMASFARADFGTTLVDAEKESKAKGKLMLVYIWSKECHVCKGLNDKTWPNIAVQNELENWAAVKIEAGEAATTHYKWKIDDVPQLRIIDPDGSEFKAMLRNDIPDAKTPEKMVEALQSVRQAYADSLSARKFDWEGSAGEAKTKARERLRPLAYFVSDGSIPAAELNNRYPQFTDKDCAAASKKFVCVAITKDSADLWEKYKPAVVPGFVFVDLDGAEIHRCGMLDGADLAKEFQSASTKFESNNIADPAKALEKALSSWDAVMKTDNEQDKLDAAQRLIDTKEVKVVKALARGLYDPSVKLKELIAPVICQIDLKTGLPELLKWVVKEQNNKVAVKGWDAVGETGDLRAVAALENDVLNAPTAEITNARIRALGNMKDKMVIDFLIDLPFKIQGKGRGPGGGGGPRGAIKNSLNKLTGQDFGDDWLGWKKWWKDSMKTFKFE